MFVRHVDGLKMKNISFRLEAPDFRSAFVMDDVKNLEIEGLELDSKGGSNPVVLRNVSQAEFRFMKIVENAIEHVKCISGCNEVSVK